MIRCSRTRPGLHRRGVDDKHVDAVMADLHSQARSEGGEEGLGARVQRCERGTNRCSGRGGEHNAASLITPNLHRLVFRVLIFRFSVLRMTHVPR